MSKQLSHEALAHLGVQELFAAKQAAFIPIYFKAPAKMSELGTAVRAAVNGTPPERFGVGIAVRDEPGYTVINSYWCHMPTYDDAANEAMRLNRDVFNLDEDTAIDIHASSMVAGKLAGGGS